MITASLDIGSEKMVMALAERGQETCRLLSIKYQPSQGMERGVVKDWEKVRSRVQNLLEECLKEGDIDFLKFWKKRLHWQYRKRWWKRWI